MAEVIVDLDAIAENVAVLARAAGPAAVMALVKADGFGHGAAPVARTALRHGASWIGVTSPAEAFALRSAGVDAPMLVWMYSPMETFDDLVAADIDVSVATVTALQDLAQAADRARTVANVHLKVDTGLSRGGAICEDWPQLLTWARKFEVAGLLRVRGIWSHLAHAEAPHDPGLRRQLAAFEAAREVAADAELDPPLLHLANSAATLHLPQTRFDLVRIGIALYGIEPVPGRVFGLRPAMTVQAQIILTKQVPAGSGVSYGPDFVTDRETTLALVPLGFADGVPRRAAGRAQVSISGVRCPIVGRVAMDQVVVDVGDLHVRTGDVAVMFGPGTHGEPTAVEWAGWADTNPHDILTGIGARLPRTYRESR